MAIIVDIDVELSKRKMSVNDFADAVGISPPTSRCSRTGARRPCVSAPSMRFRKVLECQPGDILRWIPTGWSARTVPDGHRVAQGCLVGLPLVSG